MINFVIDNPDITFSIQWTGYAFRLRGQIGRAYKDVHIVNPGHFKDAFDAIVKDLRTYGY